MIYLLTGLLIFLLCSQIGRYFILGSLSVLFQTVIFCLTSFYGAMILVVIIIFGNKR